MDGDGLLELEEATFEIDALDSDTPTGMGSRTAARRQPSLDLIEGSTQR